MSDDTTPRGLALNCLRLPQPAWELLSRHADTTPAVPPNTRGRASVILQLLKRTRPPEGSEQLYESLFGARFDELYPKAKS